MSDARGAVRFSDGLVLFCLYHGTSDICSPALVFGRDEIWDDAPHRGSWERSRACAHSEPVTIYSDYGGGFSWAGKACRACKVITEGHQPYEDEFDVRAKPVARVNGTPEWFNVAAKNQK